MDGWLIDRKFAEDQFVLLSDVNRRHTVRYFRKLQNFLSKINQSAVLHCTASDGIIREVALVTFLGCQKPISVKYNFLVALT